jgi:CRP/FNR family transcriptional regulator, cyclic AMP receptor protein
MLRTRADEKISTLAKAPLFAGCSQRELREVAKLCSPCRVEKGSVLTTEGAPARGCFFILDGTAQVAIRGQTVNTIGAGDWAGEMGLLDGGTRTATVTALTAMNTYVFSPREFRSLLHTNPAMASKVAANLARRLRAIQSG